MIDWQPARARRSSWPLVLIAFAIVYFAIRGLGL